MIECHSTVSVPPAATAGRRRRRRRIGAPQRRGDTPGDADRATQPIQPGGLIGPDVAQQRQFAVAAGGVQRCDVVAMTFDDLHGSVGGQSAAPGVVDDHRRVGWTPLAARIAVTVMVCAQVQSSAGSDLEKPDRQTESVDKISRRADQRGGPADLVGLRRLIEGGTQRSV